jgi:hypothetical protein
VSPLRRMVVWLAASAICFALVFPLAPTPTLLGKQSVVAALAMVAAPVMMALPVVWTAIQAPVSHPIQFSAVLDLTCVRLC